MLLSSVIRDMRVGNDKQSLVDCVDIGQFTSLAFCSTCIKYAGRNGMTVLCELPDKETVIVKQANKQESLPF